MSNILSQEVQNNIIKLAEAGAHENEIDAYIVNMGYDPRKIKNNAETPKPHILDTMNPPKDTSIDMPKSLPERAMSTIERGAELVAQPFVKNITLGAYDPKMATPTESLSGEKNPLEAGLAGVGEIGGIMGGGEVLGKGLGIVGKQWKKIPVIKNLANVRINIPFREKLAKEVMQPMIDKSAVFEKQANAIMTKTGKSTIDFTNVRSNIQTAIKESVAGGDASIQQVVNRSPLLSKIIDGTQDVSKISFKDAMAIKNELSGKLGSKLGKTGSFKFSDMPTYQVRSEIDDAIMNSIPELAPAKATYGQTIRDFKMIKNLADVAKNIPELKKFGDTGLNDQEIQKVLTRYLGVKNPIIKEIGGYRKTWNLLNNVIKIPWTEASLGKLPGIREVNLLGKPSEIPASVLPKPTLASFLAGLNNTASKKKE